MLSKIRAWIRPQPTPVPIQAVQPIVLPMKPISQERVNFLKDRIRVVQAMYTELLQRPAKYVVGQHDLCRSTLSAIQAEKLLLTIELDVLVEYLKTKS